MKSFFTRVWQCCFEPASYRELRTKTFWQAYRYLYFVLFVLSLGTALVMMVAFVAFLPTFTRMIDRNIEDAPTWYPEELVMTFSTDGELSTNVREPYVIEPLDHLTTYFQDEEPDSRIFAHTVIIDTSASIDDFFEYDTHILLTKKALVAFEKNEGVRAIFYSHFMDDRAEPFVVDRALYETVLSHALPFATHLPALLAVFGFLFLLVVPWIIALFWSVGILLYLLVATLLSLLLAAMQKNKMSYRQLYVLGMYAVTLPLLATVVLGFFFGLEFPFFFSLIFLTMMWLVMQSMNTPTKKRA